MKALRCLGVSSLFILVLATLACEAPGPSNQSQSSSAQAESAAPVAQSQPWTIGGDQPARPSVLIAHFATESDDGLPWGYVIGRTLSVKMQSAPRELVYIPWYVYDEFRHLHKLPAETSATVGWSSADALKLGQMYGLDYVLTGGVKKTGDQFQFTAELNQVQPASPIKIEAKGTIQDIPKILTDCSNRIFDEMKVPKDSSTRDYLARSEPARPEILREVASLVAADDKFTSRAQRAAEWAKVAAKDPTARWVRATAFGNLQGHNAQEAVGEARAMFEAEKDTFAWLMYIAMLDSADRFNDVIIECGRYLQQNPNSVNGIRCLARAYRASRSHTESMATAERYVQLTPNSWHAHFVLGLAYNSYGWSKRGTNYWHEVPEEGKRIFTEMVGKSEQSFHRALQINPNNPELLTELAGLANQSGQGAQVEALCQKALEIDPECVNAYSHLLNYYRPGYSGQMQKTMRIYQEITAKFPKNARLQALVMEDMLWFLSYLTDVQKVPYKTILSDPSFTGPMEAAISRTIALEPWDLDRRAKAGRYFYHKGEHDKAWEHLQYVTDYVPREQKRKSEGLHEWYREVGWVALKAKQYDQAITLAGKCLQANACPQCREVALVELALSYDRKHEFDTASKHYEEVIRCGGTYASWGNSNFAILIHDHKPEMIQHAINYARVAVNMQPDNAVYHVNLGRCYLKNHNRQEALAEANQALRLDPKSEDAKELLGEINGKR